MVGEEFNNLCRVVGMTLHTQRQCLKSLQENPGVERRDAGAFVAKQQGADACHERSGKLAEDQAVVRGVGLGEARELVVSDLVHENAYQAKAPEEMAAMLKARQGLDGEDFDRWLLAFCKRKWNCAFSEEMTRSAAQMIAEWREGK